MSTPLTLEIDSLALVQLRGTETPRQLTEVLFIQQQVIAALTRDVQALRTQLANLT